MAASYLILKKAYNNKTQDFTDDFKKVFSAFYGIRFASEDFRTAYFDKMQELRNHRTGDVNVAQLTNELIDKWSKGKKGEIVEKVQFSFVTKLLNIMNDREYPIYDSNIIAVFGFKAKDKPKGSDSKAKIEKYVKLYDEIREVSQKLVKDYGDKIKLFRENICHADNEELSDLRIIDLLIWKLGERD